MTAEQLAIFYNELRTRSGGRRWSPDDEIEFFQEKGLLEFNARRDLLTQIHSFRRRARQHLRKQQELQQMLLPLKEVLPDGSVVDYMKQARDAFPDEAYEHNNRLMETIDERILRLKETHTVVLELGEAYTLGLQKDPERYFHLLDDET